MKYLAGISIACIAVMVSCATTANKPDKQQSPQTSADGLVVNPNRHLPKAIVYRTNIPVDNHPTVKVSDSGNELISYPDPRDIRGESRPIKLTDGWLLDRQGGISKNSRFLKYTYDEYAALPQVPSHKELLGSLLKDVRVTDVRVLDITLQEAIADTAAVSATLLQLLPKLNPTF